MSNEHKVSIGLPVFNGEQFLALAIDSLLNQTYRNIELIISDNASTDATPDICQRYASLDPRVRYSRLPTNTGGVPNALRVFSLASAPYFMWAAHDDVWQPTYVEKCVRSLDADPGAVLACSKMAIIDESGTVERLVETEHGADSPRPSERLREFTEIYSISDASYGVTRTETLRQTRLYPLHPGADKILLAELALRGRFIRLPEYLYMRRVHGGRSVSVYPDLRARYAWISPACAGKRMFPHWGYLRGYTGAVLRARLTFRERLSCGILLLKWVKNHVKELAQDLKPATSSNGEPLLS